jgi:hypothetical protein
VLIERKRSLVQRASLLPLRRLGEPIPVVKRWRAEGMPVVEQGRFVTSSPEQLSA